METSREKKNSRLYFRADVVARAGQERGWLFILFSFFKYKFSWY